MFEKEAQERAEEIEANQTLGVYDNDEDLARDSGWNDGYVSGYEEGFQDGAEFGYNKANEWHEIESKVLPKREISKQYMPKNKEKVLLKYHFCDDEIHISDGYYDAYDFKFHIANNPKHKVVCVIAWKEVVLPELKEE